MKVQIGENLLKIALDSQLSKGEEYAAIEVQIPILGIGESYTEGDLIPIQIMGGNKTKGWLYQKVRYIAFKIDDTYRLVLQKDLQANIEKRCQDKTFSTTPMPNKLHQVGDKI